MCTYHVHTQQRANSKNQIQQPRTASSTFRQISRLASRQQTELEKACPRKDQTSKNN